MKTKLSPVATRRMEFDGVHKNDSLLIGNFGDVHFMAKGSFQLSGMIYNTRHTTTFSVHGDGYLNFHGACRRLVVEYANGNCVLDFSGLECREACLVVVKGRTEMVLGPTKVITRANLGDDAVLRYLQNPIFTNYSVTGHARIEPLTNFASLRVG